eukprot:m.64768 g.64768  ORF g.64768 m.64768 type:complete len:188 (+) comp8245_c0_seq2:138-701(+)
MAPAKPSAASAADSPHTIKVVELNVPDGGVDANVSEASLGWGSSLEVVGGTNETLAPGDVVFIPQFFTGAGEYEGVFFAGERSEDGERIRLHCNCDVEVPAIPAAIAAMMSSRGSDLATTYLRAIVYVIEELHHCFVDDMYESRNELASELNGVDREEGVAGDVDEGPIVTLRYDNLNPKVLFQYTV